MGNVTVREGQLAGLPWLSLSGSRTAVFHALGEWGARRIRAVQGAMPEREALRRWADTERGRARLDALWASTLEHHPGVAEELTAMSQGARIDLADVFLANVRGDVGSYDGTGCTDLAWRRARSVVAHNEDGAPALAGSLTLVSLHVDGEEPVFAQWYPGFVPSNAFVVTGSGLAWGINHLPVAEPGVGAPRHAVARALQCAATLDDAVAYLQDHPMAGGFAFTIGEFGTGQVVVVESAAGEVALAKPGAAAPYAWHTNHTVLLPGASAEATGQLGGVAESRARGRALSSAPLPPGEPDDEWFLDVLTGAELPAGVYRTARGEDPLMTLCSTVVDLASEMVTVRSHLGEADRLSRLALVAGPPD